MSQMSPADQAIVGALPGNDRCCDCPQKHPQWASVSFGILLCLDCSGLHRSLGVHISFVRSVAMDSWTEKQLQLMKTGGNKKCNDHLKAKGINPDTPAKAKYEPDAAQLYKEILKARVEGRPEPTALPPPRNKRAAAPSSSSSGMGMSGMGGGGPKGSNDPAGLERMTGETDQQYIARQTRLKAEAQARMRAKFGNNSGRMGGVGSNSNYNPNGAGGGYGIGAPDMDNVINSVSGAFSSGLSMVSSAVNDESARASVSNLANTATSYGGSFWNSLKTTVGDVATSVARPDGEDGLSALQRDIQSQKPKTSKYSGFGSTNNNNNNTGGGGTSTNFNPSSSSMFASFGSNTGVSSNGGGMGRGGAAGLQEAQGMPGEDRNGMERLTGESDEQYVLRQTRQHGAK
uniref:Arf-GAP domain-containing protein n=2 Tax=Pseudo-nitzschia australis TaxID=44445 RepID=A0A7S4AP65_9STRA